MLEFFNDPKVAEQLGYLVEHVPFAVWETVYTTVVASLFAYLIGLPLGVLLVVLAIILAIEGCMTIAHPKKNQKV